MVKKIPTFITGKPELADKTAYRKVQVYDLSIIPMKNGNVYNKTASNSDCIPLKARNKSGVTKRTLRVNGNYECEVLACSWSNFSKAQPELVKSLKYMLQAAEEQGCTLLISDVTRTKKTSDECRAKKGDLVAKGGESPHNYGAAVDIRLYKNGKAINVDSDEYQNFAKKY